MSALCSRSARRSTPSPRVLAIAVLLAALLSQSASASGLRRDHGRARWFSAWSRSQSVPVAAAADPLDGGRGPGPLMLQSVRDVVRVSAAGREIRVQLSNRYGPGLAPDQTAPLHVLAASVGARRSGAAVSASSLRSLRFKGLADVSIAPGDTVTSDPVALPVSFGEDLAVSLYVQQTPVAPSHGASFVTSYLTSPGAGDHTRDMSGAAYTQRTFSTPIVSGVDVRSDRLQGVVAATGGSVVDGFGTQIDEHADFPSWLAQRVRGRLSVVNNGLGGTTASSACAPPGVGPSVDERVEHDSLSQSGITDLIVYAGTNDLGDGCLAPQIIAAFQSIARQAHAHHVRVLISTITPRSQYTSVQNQERVKVNAWVRSGGDCSGACDHSLDFDAVIRDPSDPNRINPSLDSGDGVHPTGQGYRLIAASIPVGEL